MDFSNTAAARTCSNQALAIEDKYSLVLMNYCEFEQTLHRLALENLLYQKNQWADFVEKIRDVNRVLMNLLTAMKMYLDQTPQHINKIFDPSRSQSEIFTAATRSEFDNSLGYRVVYTLRNHAQHGDFPIQSLSLGSAWRGDGIDRHCAHTATAFVCRDDVAGNKNLNAKVRKEISEMQEKIDVSPLIRESMSSFARLHAVVRETLRKPLNAADSILQGAYARFEAHAGRKPVGLCIAHIDEDGREIESHNIFMEAIERRLHLEHQSILITNIEKHYISAQKV